MKKNKIHMCALCAKSFTAYEYPYRKRKYCSRECHYKDKKQYSTNCKHCGNIFYLKSKGSKQRCCSLKCARLETLKFVPMPSCKGMVHTDETKVKMRNAKLGKSSPGNTGKHHSAEAKKKMSEGNKGREQSEEVRKKHSKSMLGKNWKNGNTKENMRIRQSIETRLWREAVFARDNWTCQKCNIRGSILHPHHIRAFAKFPELRFAIDNGITFCFQCHVDGHKNSRIFKVPQTPEAKKSLIY